MSFFWFCVGFAVGLNLAVAIAWWRLRRKNRKTERILSIVNNPNLTGIHDLKMTVSNLPPSSDEHMISSGLAQVFKSRRPW
jgi:hypothetical protein